MTEPTAQKLTELAREFVERLRATLSQSVSEEPDRLVERALSIGAVLVAAALAVVKADKKGEALVVALLSAALRRFATRKEVATRG